MVCMGTNESSTIARDFICNPAAAGHQNGIAGITRTYLSLYQAKCGVAACFQLAPCLLVLVKVRAGVYSVCLESAHGLRQRDLLCRVHSEQERPFLLSLKWYPTAFLREFLNYAHLPRSAREFQF